MRNGRIGQRGRDDRVDRSGRWERNSPGGQGNRGVRRGRHGQKCRGGGTARAGPNRRYRVRSSAASRRVASLRFALHCHGNQPPVEGRGCVGWRDRCAAWMRLTSPQGWVYGASREPTHPRPGHGQSALTLLRGRGKPTKNPLHKQRVLRCCHYVAEASSIRTCSSHPACTCGPTPRTPAVDPSCQRRCDTARWSDCFPAATASAHADCCCPRRCS